MSGSGKSVCLVCLKSTSEEVVKQEPELKIDPDDASLYKRFLMFAEDHLQMRKSPVTTFFLPTVNKLEVEGHPGSHFFNMFCSGCRSDIRVICQLYHELCDIRLRLNLRVEALTELMETSSEIALSDNISIDSLYCTLAEQLRINEVGGDKRQAQEMRELLVKHGKMLSTITPPDPDPCEFKDESHPEVISGGGDFDHFHNNYDDDGGNELQMDMLLFPRDDEQEMTTGDPLADGSFPYDANSSTNPVVGSSKLGLGTTRLTRASSSKSSSGLIASVGPSPSEILTGYNKTNCDSCGTECGDQAKLQEHVTEVHESKTALPRFHCYLCFRSFSTEQGLVLHLKLFLHRGRSLSFNCEQHSRGFCNPGELSEHFQIEHSDEAIYSCSYCEWPFLDQYQKELHELVHVRSGAGEKKSRYRCPVCSMSCGDTHILQSHYNKSHGKNIVLHPCPQCASKFMSYYSLNLHLEKVHRVARPGSNPKKIKPKPKGKPTNPVSSQFVQKKKIRPVPPLLATSTYSLTNIGKRSKNVCNICGKGFLTRSHLKRHLGQVHKSVDFSQFQYQCSICQRRFQTVDNLKTHFVNMHAPAGGNSTVTPPPKTKTPSAPSRVSKAPPPTRVVLPARRTRASGAPQAPATLINRLRKVPPSFPNASRQKRSGFSCTDCGKSFKTKSSMYDHRHLVHGSGLRQCPHCSKCFRRPFLLKNHLTSGQCTGQLPQVIPEEESTSGLFVGHQILDDEDVNPLLMAEVDMEEADEILF